jgi:hypothetical protein
MIELFIGIVIGGLFGIIIGAALVTKAFLGEE